MSILLQHDNNCDIDMISRNIKEIDRHFPRNDEQNMQQKQTKYCVFVKRLYKQFST